MVNQNKDRNPRTRAWRSCTAARTAPRRESPASEGLYRHAQTLGKIALTCGYFTAVGL